jgi:hypothetical protein
VNTGNSASDALRLGEIVSSFGEKILSTTLFLAELSFCDCIDVAVEERLSKLKFSDGNGIGNVIFIFFLSQFFYN